MKSTFSRLFRLHRRLRISLLLIAVLSIVTAHARTYTDPDYQVVYTLDEINLTASVTAENTSLHKNNATALVILDKFIDNEVEYTVTSIVKEAFKGTAITAIDIRANVPSIPQNCFQGCNNLATVTLPSSEITIGQRAFDGCGNLATINLENATAISEYAFYGCVALTDILLTSATTVDKYAFEGCEKLHCPDLSNIATVGSRAFALCPSLGEVIIPSGTKFASAAFRGSSISSLTFSKNSETIQDLPTNMFNDVKTLKSVKFPSYYNTIPNSLFASATDLETVDFSDCGEDLAITQYSFSNCASLTTVIFPHKIKSIGLSAFSNTGMISVTLPSVESISSSAFANSKIANITWPETKIESLASGIFQRNSLTELTIPAWLTDIPESMFFANKDLVTLHLSEGLVSIGRNAFQSCSIEELTLPSTVTTIYNNAFKENNLSELTLNENLRTIGSYAFNSNKITSLTIPSTIESMGESSFSLNGMETLILSEGIETLDDGVFTQNVLTSLVFPSTLKKIGDRTFQSNLINELTFTTGPDGNTAIEEIGASAFETNRLTTLVIPNSLTKIQDKAFYKNLIENLTLGNSVAYIGNNAFQNNSLENLEIPESVKEICSGAFSDNLLVNVVFPEADNADFPPISFDRSVFSSNSFTEFTFPAWLTVVPEYFLASNPNLGAVTFAPGTTKILSSAFAHDYLLQVGDFPSTIVYYGENAFSNAGSKLSGGKYLGTVHIGGGVEIAKNAFKLARIKEVCFDDCDYTLGENIFESVTSVSKISFAPCMTVIPQGICKNWSQLTEVIWPDRLEEIQADAFYGCSKLNFGSDNNGHRNVLDLSKAPFYIPGDNFKSLKIGGQAFSGTTIDHIMWPTDQLYWEFENSFQDCKSLKSLSLPAWLDNLAPKMFYGCTNLSELSWDIDNWTADDWANSVYGSKENYKLTIGENCFYNAALTTISWADVPTSLGGYAFASNRKATKIVWPESAATLDGSYVFSSCTSLAEPTTVPDYITAIPEYTFFRCSSLPEFTLHDKITSVKQFAFANCEGLKTFNYGCNVPDVPNHFLVSCKKLETFTATYPITSFGMSSFNDCSSLVGLSLNNGDTKLSNIYTSAFSKCSNLPEFPDVIDGLTKISQTAFSNTDNLRHIVLPTSFNSGNYYVDQNSGLQAVDFVNTPNQDFKINKNEFKSCPMRGVSTYFDTPRGFTAYNEVDRGENKGVLLVNRDMKYKFVESGYDKLWNIIEVKQPKLELQGEIYSSFTPGETKNHYRATLLWEVCESDLNPIADTEYFLYRDGKKRAKIAIGNAVLSPTGVSDGNINVSTPVNIHNVRVTMYDDNGEPLPDGMSQFFGDFTYQTGENTFTMIYANQQTKLYFDPESTHRIGLNEKMGAKSWFLFIDEFDSPDLEGLYVPSSYSYTLRMSGYNYTEPRNNEGYEPYEGEEVCWHNETFTLDDIVSEPCKVYTSMAVPSLTFGGTYTREEIDNDVDGLLPPTQPIGENGDVSVTYAFADRSHVLHKLDGTPIIDHITSYEIGVGATSRSTDDYAEWETIDIKGNTSLSAGEMVVPKDKNPGVGSSFQLVTHTEGRGTFGSRVVTIPGAPRLDIELERSFVYGDEEGHGHNTVVRHDITLYPDVLEMDFPTAMPPASHHHIGVWRTLKHSEVSPAAAARRAASNEDDIANDNSASEELIHHAGAEYIEHTWNCNTCNDAQGYTPGETTGVYTDHIAATQDQSNLASKYRVRMYVQTPYDEDQWMIAENSAEKSGIVTEIPNVGINSDTPIYFNLQGIRVIHPREGEFLIMVDRAGSHRIRYSAK